MLMPRQSSLVLTVILSLFATIANAEPDLDRGAAVFKRCVACHELERPRHKMGPHLLGLEGRKAGSLDGFNYSQAMRDAGAAGLVWDQGTLAEFIASPKKAVPGTSMRFFGLWSESDIKDVIAYMNSMSKPAVE
jgi:cytochrome c